MVGVWCLVIFGTLGMQGFHALDPDSCTYIFRVPQAPGSECGDEIHIEIDQIWSDINTLNSMVTDLENGIDCSGKPENETGATYVRWGRNVCSTGATALYNGYVTTSGENHYGGSADYVCMPSEPDFSHGEGVQSGSYLYGSEYRLLGEQDPFSRENTNNQSIIYFGAPCVECMADRKWTVHTFEGFVKCPEGWHQEYTGYIMTNWYRSKGRVGYVCIDVAPEVLPERTSYTYGSYLYLTETKCGVLPCPNYHDGWELPCAVCSK